MEKDLEKLKKIFLSSDIDEEDYQSNLETIQSWERSIRENEDFASWQESDITRSVLKQIKDSYKDIFMRLGNGKNLDDQQRIELFAKKEALMFLIDLISKDTKKELEGIHNDIKRSLNSL